MKTIVLSLVLFLLSILTFLSSARSGNAVIPRFKEDASSYRVIKLDSRDDRKLTIVSLKEQEDDEGDDEDDDEGDDSGDEEEG